MTVADFHQQFVAMITALGGDATFHRRPNELPDPVPFADDTASRPYDADAVSRFHKALVAANHVLQDFRTGFRGKVSPVHLFWGSFDLAVTRFSGRRAPLHPGGIPNLPDGVTQEAYSHEVSSAGFWPGGGPIDDAAILPEAASYNGEFGEFVLPYEAVRTAENPEATLMAFLESTFEAAARLGDWDRSLECDRGLKGAPHAID